MDADHAEIWLQKPAAPAPVVDEIAHHPAPAYEQEKIASNDLLLMGMMLWMEQGLVLEWLTPPREDKEEKNAHEGGQGHHHS